jgi:hypothetical protein
MTEPEGSLAATAIAWRDADPDPRTRAERRVPGQIRAHHRYVQLQPGRMAVVVCAILIAFRAQ